MTGLLVISNVFTDAFLALVAAACAIATAATPERPGLQPSGRLWWVIGFALIAVASSLGAIFHAVVLTLSPQALQALWKVLLLTAGLAAPSLTLAIGYQRLGARWRTLIRLLALAQLTGHIALVFIFDRFVVVSVTYLENREMTSCSWGCSRPAS